MTAGAEGDARAAVVAATAWLIVANKPFYPLWVGWVAGDGLAAWPTVATLPAYAAIALLARRHSLTARLALPIVGAIDTLLATKLFGAASGTELFLVPCLLLAVVAFNADEEALWSRGLLVGLGGVFVAARVGLGAALGPWSGEAAAALLGLNAFSVAGLSFFLGWRFAGIR